MKIEGLVITAAEIAVIAVMGLCGWLALSQSGAYGWIKEWISSRSTAAEHFLPVIIWGAIFVFGLVTVTLGKKGCGALTWVVVVISLPSFLAFNSLDLLKILDTRLTITTELSFLQAMSLGTVIMTCYCLMSSMNVLKQSRTGLLRRQASIGDVENVYSRSVLYMLVGCGVGLTAAIVTYFLANSLDGVITGKLPQIPWYIMWVGIGCVLVLGIYLYWIGTMHGRTQ